MKEAFRINIVDFVNVNINITLNVLEIVNNAERGDHMIDFYILECIKVSNLCS